MRTLEYAFRETFDLTPLAFVRRRRLQAARRDLWRADPTRTTVTRVALRHGFHHPSRFAAYYRRSFGESPSATLSRAGTESVGEMPPLTPEASASHASREQT
jgi:AraC-like DNA-binding protein